MPHHPVRRLHEPGNAAELLAQPDVDGGLIGGASLKADQFSVIVEAASVLRFRRRGRSPRLFSTHLIK